MCGNRECVQQERLLVRAHSMDLSLVPPRLLWFHTFSWFEWTMNHGLNRGCKICCAPKFWWAWWPGAEWNWIVKLGTHMQNRHSTDPGWNSWYLKQGGVDLKHVSFVDLTQRLTHSAPYQLCGLICWLSVEVLEMLLHLPDISQHLPPFSQPGLLSKPSSMASSDIQCTFPIDLKSLWLIGAKLLREHCWDVSQHKCRVWLSAQCFPSFCINTDDHKGLPSFTFYPKRDHTETSSKRQFSASRIPHLS